MIDGLLERGHRVWMLHSGRHKPDRTWYDDGRISKIITNPFRVAELTAALDKHKEEHGALGVDGKMFDNVFAMYGRLREICRLFSSTSGSARYSSGRFFSVGGIPVYAGYSDPTHTCILTAVSDDGLKWQKGSEPVILPGGPHDAAKCSEMAVMQLPQISGQPPRYRMFWEGCDGTAPDKRGVWRIVSATSALATSSATG